MVKYILFLTLMLSACSHTEYIRVPPKEPPVIARPELETDRLKPGDDAGTVIQYHRITIKRLQQWGLELEAALDAYRSKK